MLGGGGDGLSRHLTDFVYCATFRLSYVDYMGSCRKCGFARQPGGFHPGCRIAGKGGARMRSSQAALFPPAWAGTICTGRQQEFCREV